MTRHLTTATLGLALAFFATPISARAQWNTPYQYYPYQWSWNQYGQPSYYYPPAYYPQGSQQGNWQGYAQQGWGQSGNYHPGYGQQGWNSAYGQQQGWGQPGYAPGFAQQWAQGQIQQTKQIQLPGMNQKMLVAVVKTNQGQRCIVNLGPVNKTQQFDLNNGDQLQVRGPQFQIDNQRLIMAEEIRVNGQMARLWSPGGQYAQFSSNQFGAPPPSTEQGQYASNNQGYNEENQSDESNASGSRFRQGRVTGQIQQTQKLQAPGFDQPMLVAVVKTSQGNTAVINLGPAQDVQEIQLQNGQQITVRGLICQHDGHQFIFAKQVQAGEQSTQIDAFQNAQPRRQRVNGQIEQTKEVRLPSIDQPMLLGVVKTDQGQQVLVNFGPPEEVQQLRLAHGVQVQIQGEGFQAAGHRLMLAEQVHANGQTANLSE